MKSLRASVNFSGDFMPYIAQNLRSLLDTPLEQIEAILSASEGDFEAILNYLICRISDAHLIRQGTRYANINRIIGAIECSKQEIYRRLAAGYEDSKIAENGDAFYSQK